MLTISPIAGGGSAYYLNESDRKSEYYLSGNSRTYWGGGAKEALGLKDGEIQKEDFDRLLDGYVPGGKRIGSPCKENGWKHDQGRDFTLSDPKSVSILLQSPLRKKLLQIKHDAVAKAMAYGEQNFAKARIKGEFVGDQKMIWAAVNEDTSRANDPNGHAHIVVFNIIQGTDGEYRALDNRQFYDNQILLGQIYRAELAKGVKEIGFEIEPAGKHGQWEIKDIPKDIREDFSKRRQAILEKIDPENDTAKAREKICLITRPCKQNILRAELKKQWSAELAKHGTSFEDLAKPKSQTLQQTPWKIEERVKASVNIIAETQTHVSTHNLYRDIMDRTDGHFTIDQIKGAVDRQIDKGALVRSKDGGYLARSVDLRRETLVMEELAKGHNQSKPLLTQKQFEDTVKATILKNDQIDSVDLITRSHDRVGKIKGVAGTGKTTALQIAIPAIKANGYKVIGLSTTSNSTDELRNAGVFDKVMTFQRYLLTPEGGKNTVLIVDESSMIGRDQMLSLMRYVNQRKLARVIFQGDPKQMSGVQAGMPFKDMEKAGVRSVTMDEIIRQKDMRHRQGITELTQGDLRKAFETLRPEFHQVPLDKMSDYAIKAWRDTGNVKTPIIIQTNRQKHEINAAIKAEQLKSDPDAKSLTLKTWQTVHKTDTEKKFVENFKDATHIRFNCNYAGRFGIRRGDIFKLEHIDKDNAALILSKGGKTRTFRPARYNMAKGAIELYRQEERTLHEGDRIRFTRGGHRQPVNNNQYGTVKSIKGNKVTFDLDRKTKKVLTLTLKDKTIRHIDHAWASTTHAFQGKTVDHAVVVMPSRKSPLTSLESLYTSASRHRLSLTVVTDDADRLQHSIAKTLATDKMHAEIRWPDIETEQAKRLDVQKGILGQVLNRTFDERKETQEERIDRIFGRSRNPQSQEQDQHGERTHPIVQDRERSMDHGR